MEVMVVDGEVDAKNESYDDDSVAEGRFETTLIETVKTHRDECDADEGPVVDYCGGPDEEGEEMVVGEHPDAIGEENGHHCQRRVYETRARRIHSGGKEKQEPQGDRDGVAEHLSCAGNKDGLTDGANEGQEHTNRVEHHHLVSSQNVVHDSGKEGKGNENRIGS